MGKLNQTVSLRMNKKDSDFEINLNNLILSYFEHLTYSSLSYTFLGGKGLVDPPHQV